MKHCTQTLDYFTVSLHSPNGRHLPAVRAVQGYCQWPLKNNGNSYWSLEPTMHCRWGFPQSTPRPTNHRRVSLTHWKLCFIFHELRDLILKPAGPWMDPYFHLSIHCILIVFSYTLSREYRVVRNRYSRLLFTSEDRFCANLRVQEQSTSMTSQWQ